MPEILTPPKVIRTPFDRGSVIGTFKFRQGAAPTSRGLIHQEGGGAHVIPGRPGDWPDPPEDAAGRAEWEADIAWSVKRALTGQTPPSLRVLSYLFARSEDHGDRLVVLRAEFSPDPSGAELEEIGVAQSEVAADFVYRCRVVMELRGLAPSEEPDPWPLVAYRATG
jgi:hypothetical protein